MLNPRELKRKGSGCIVGRFCKEGRKATVLSVMGGFPARKAHTGCAGLSTLIPALGETLFNRGKIPAEKEISALG